MWLVKGQGHIHKTSSSVTFDFKNKPFDLYDNNADQIKLALWNTLNVPLWESKSVLDCFIYLFPYQMF